MISFVFYFWMLLMWIHYCSNLLVLNGEIKRQKVILGKRGKSGWQRLWGIALQPAFRIGN